MLSSGEGLCRRLDQPLLAVLLGQWPGRGTRGRVGFCISVCCKSSAGAGEALQVAASAEGGRGGSRWLQLQGGVL